MKKNNIITEIEQIPVWALCALINDDYTGLSSEDCKAVMEWIKDAHYDIIAPPQDDNFPYFCARPAFGLPCNVYNIECIRIL